MTPVIKHLPLHPVRDHADMTPDEISAWLRERERQNELRAINTFINACYVIVCAALIVVTIGFFTH